MPDGADNQLELSEIDDLLNPASAVPEPAAIIPLPLPPFEPEPIPISSVAARSTSTSAAQPVPKPKLAAPLSDDDPPLFERGLDAVLGPTYTQRNGADDAKAKPHATTGMDSMSLGGEHGHIVLSSQKATALAVVAVVLLALAFAAGYLVGAK